MKKFFTKAAAAVGAFSPALLFAEGTPQIDLTPATTALTDMTTAVQGWITTAAPILVKLLAAGLLITLIFVVLSMTKKGTKRATS